MTLLDRLQSELSDVNGPIRSNDLASRLGVAPSALDGMLETLTRLGRLNSTAAEESTACTGVSCGSGCTGIDACPFVANVPDSYSLVALETDRPAVPLPFPETR